MKLQIALALVLALAQGGARPNEFSCSLSIKRRGEVYDIAAKNMDAKLLLTEFFRVADEKVSIDWDVLGEINSDFTSVGFTEALDRVTRTVDATYQVEQGRYRIMRRQGESASNFGRIERKYLIEGSAKSIDAMELDYADIRGVLEDLSSLVDIPISVDQRVTGRVDVRAKSLRFDVALKLLLDQVGAKYTRDSQGIHVVPG